MRNRTKLFISALVAGASFAAAAVPAQAQSYPDRQSYPDSQSRDRYDDHEHRYDDRDQRYDERYENRHDNRWDDRGQANAIRSQIDQLERRIQRTDGRDRISEREAAMLRRAVYNLRQQYRDYARNGLTQREFQILRSRIQQVRERLSYERRDNDGRRW